MHLARFSFGPGGPHDESLSIHFSSTNSTKGQEFAVLVQVGGQVALTTTIISEENELQFNGRAGHPAEDSGHG